MFTNILVTFAIMANGLVPSVALLNEGDDTYGIESVDVDGGPCTGYIGVLQGPGGNTYPIPGETPWCPPPAGAPTYPYSVVWPPVVGHIGCTPTFDGNQIGDLIPGSPGFCWPSSDEVPTEPGETPTVTEPPYVPVTTESYTTEPYTTEPYEPTSAEEETRPGLNLPQTGAVAANLAIAGAALVGIGTAAAIIRRRRR